MRNGKFKYVVIAVVVVALVIVGLVIKGGSPSTSTTTNGSSAGKTANTITFAEGPGASPNWIFPYMSCTYFSVSNINAFINEMYR
ncbi:MAG: hypothetical protein ACYC0I_04435, partial [Acidimicrobiales bacterium]